MRRVFYFAPISTDEINAIYGGTFLAGAATNKVFGICAALRSAGVRAVAVSGLVPTRDPRPWRGLVLHRTRNTPYAKVWALGRGLAKRVTAGLGYLLFTIRFVRRRDRVLLYNFFPDYVPAALYLRIIGRPAILDIEDAPPADEPGARGLMNRIGFRVLRLLCAERCVTVSHHLGQQLRLPHYLPVHRVAEPMEGAPTSRERFAAERVGILFGGSIMRETGLGLFSDALRLVARDRPDLPARIVVTGIYPEAELRALRAHVEAVSSLTIELRPALDAATYRALLDEVAIGLSLKLPETGIGQTTFPSKVIEYAAAGLLIVATPVSDIPALFADAAVLLDGNDPADLAERLAAAIGDRAGSAALAERGTAAVRAQMSREAVGARLAAFLFDERG